MQQYGKRIKSKLEKMLRETSEGGLFALSPPPILNRVKNEFTDSRSAKTIKKEKDRFHCFIACSVEVICSVTVIKLENMFGDIQMFLPTEK